MSVGTIEIYRPRSIRDLGIWEIGPLQIKAHGLMADRCDITDGMIATARAFLADEVPARVAAMGESNGLGFVIIHPGDTGLSIAAHWWAQGSVLCQHFFRQPYGDDRPLDTSTRPAVACVWELAVIDAEQKAWRAAMMTAKPDRQAYLQARPQFDAA